jgi:hypothetical protein
MNNILQYCPRVFLNLPFSKENRCYAMNIRVAYKLANVRMTHRFVFKYVPYRETYRNILLNLKRVFQFFATPFVRNMSLP